MAKIHRNNPCPCGSGKKYKNCCGAKIKQNDEKDRKELPPSPYQLLIIKYFSSNYLDLETERNRLLKILYDRTIKKGSIENGQDIEFLRIYLVECETLLEEIASEHSIYELLYWSRRLGPKNIFNVSDISVMLYRTIQSLAIYKYGLMNEQMSSASDQSIYPSYLDEYYQIDLVQLGDHLKNNDLTKRTIKAISSTISLETAAHLYLRATQVYRMVNKGGAIVINKFTKELDADINKDLAFRIELFDNRGPKMNLMSHTGTYVNMDDFSIGDSKAFYPHMSLNVDHKSKWELINMGTGPYKKIFDQYDQFEMESNFLLTPISTKDIYKFIQLFEDEFEAKLGFKAREFMMFISYLGYKIVSDFASDIGFQISIMNRAYTIADFNLKAYGEEFTNFAPILYKSLFNEELNYTIDIEKILNSFLLSFSNRRDIDLWTRGPQRFLYQVNDNYMVIDYWSLTHIVQYLVKDLTAVDGEVGNKRARHFEEQIIQGLETIYGKDSMWVTQGIIRAVGQAREIDASFVIKDVLFLVEAKAVNVSFGFDKGNKASIDFRIGKMKAAIKECNDKAKFIETNIKSIHPNLPDGIKYICPIIVSSYPEYIWEDTEDLYISKELKLPRIMTVDELAELRKINLDVVKKKKWTIKLE